MPQFEVPAHGVPAKVEVAVFHPNIVAPVGHVFDFEWRHVRRVQHRQSRGPDFDIACGNVRIFSVSLNHFACCLHHKLAAQGAGHREEFG